MKNFNEEVEKILSNYNDGLHETSYDEALFQALSSLKKLILECMPKLPPNTKIGNDKRICTMSDDEFKGFNKYDTKLTKNLNLEE